MNVEDLQKYKDNLYTSLSRDLSEFEKNFILVATGILAFTITFIKDIVKLEEDCCVYLLIISWGLIIISIGLMMITFLRSAKASDDLFKVVDDFIIQNSLYNNSAVLNEVQAKNIKVNITKAFYPIKKILRWLRYLAIIFFILGITVLASFVYLNLENKSKTIISSQNQTTIIIKDTTNIDSSNFRIIYEKFRQTGTAIKAKDTTK